MTSRLFTKYKEEVLPRLQKQFNYKNIMQTPGLVKVVVNIGVNEAKIDMKYMDAAINELTIIAAQRPMMKRAKKSVAGFKVREGMPVACCVTLRGDKCGPLQTGLSALLCLGSRTSKEFLPELLTAAGITTWD